MTQPTPRSLLWTLCLTVTVSYGTLYYTYVVLAPQISRETGWSLTALTAAFSLGSVVSGIVGIAAGSLIQARGPRGVMVVGAIAGAAGLAGIAAAPTYPWFVVAMIVCGIGAAGVFYAPAFAAITHWFGSHRVRALTTLTLVAGFASTVFAPLATALAAWLGWRGTYGVFAVVMLALVAPAHLTMLRHPWPAATGDAAHAQRDRSVLASRRFVLAASGATLITLAMYASLVSLVPLLVQGGISTTTAAWILGIGGAGQVAGRLLYPQLTRTLSVGTRVVAVSLMVAVTIGAFAFTPAIAVLLVLTSVVAGAARGLFTLVGATLVTDLWGPERYASLNGVLGAPVAIAAALGPFVGASLATASGGYATAYVVLSVVGLVGAGLLGVASRPLASEGAGQDVGATATSSSSRS